MRGSFLDQADDHIAARDERNLMKQVERETAEICRDIVLKYGDVGFMAAVEIATTFKLKDR